MPKVTTKITNKKTSPISLALPMKYSMSTKSQSLGPGKSIQLDFDVWSKLSQTNKLRLEKLIRTNQIEVDTKVWTNDNKIVTIGTSSVNIDKAPAITNVTKASNTRAASDRDPSKKIESPFNTTAERNVVKGYKIVEGSDAINRLGFSTADKDTTFDHSKALQNNNDTKGFAETSGAGVVNLVNKTDSDSTKVDAPGLFNTSNESTSLEQSQGDQNSLLDQIHEVPTTIIDRMLSQGDIDQLKEYLTELYPDIKFTKKALKDCKTAEDVKLKFGLNDLL